ncbi:MAG: glycosyltransferase family 2 protein [Rhodospirillaceae bacterium]
MTAPNPSPKPSSGTALKLRLSVLMCIHNEEARLRPCLERLGFADELVIVLDRCTDGSRAIAAEFVERVGAGRLVEGKYELEGTRRNAAIEAATGDWLLEVDADEHIPPALAMEIRAIVASSPCDWHALRVDNFIGERLVRHGWGAAFGTTQVSRLFRKNAKHWGDQRVHPKVKLRGQGGLVLATPFLHYVDRDISDMIRRLDRYSDARAGDLRASGQIGREETLGRNLRRVLSRFYKCYVLRRGYREGEWGVLIALMAGLYPLLSYLKAKLEKK